MNQVLNPRLSGEVRRSADPKQSFVRAAIYLVLIALAIVCAIPFYSMIIYSTHANSDIATKFLWLPGNHLADNYREMQTQINIWRGFLNSIVISALYTILTGFFGGLTAFGFAKYRFRMNKHLFWFVLATMMIPSQLGLIGFYRLMNVFHMLNTYWPLILPALANGYTVFFIRQFIDSMIPDEVIESARIDGCAEFGIYYRIVLPMITPAVAALSIFMFIHAWNNFLAPLVLLFSREFFPLPVLIAQLKGMYSTDYGTLYLGVAISVVPIILVFLFASKRIIGSLTVGAVKG